MAYDQYYLGSSSPDGFISSVRELTDSSENTIFILKGTAGSGKSTLMKKIADAFSDCEGEIFRCSSDPASLDAVYIKDKKFLMIDGTAPHCLDPVYPKAVQTIVDLGTYLEDGMLRKERSAIIEITDKYAAYHNRVRLILSAASSVISDILTTSSWAVNTKKLESFTARTVRRLIADKKTALSKGSLLTRQISAVTMNGYTSLIPQCANIFILNDENGSASDMFLKLASKRFTNAGFDVIVSRCLFSKEQFAEHIYIPELDTAFMSSGLLSTIDIDEPAAVINFKRFYCKDIFDKTLPYRSRLKFGRSAAKELLSEAAAELTAAKAVHDRIEEYYIAAADFDSINRLSYKLISDIRSL